LRTAQKSLAVLGELRSDKRPTDRPDEDKRNRTRHVSGRNAFRRGITILLCKRHIDTEHRSSEEKQGKTRH